MAGKPRPAVLGGLGPNPRRRTWAAGQLLASGTDAILFGDAINGSTEAGNGIEGCPDSVSALRGQLDRLVEGWSLLADRMEGRRAFGGHGFWPMSLGDHTQINSDSRATNRSLAIGSARGLPRVSDDVLRQAGIGCLARWRDQGDQGQSAIATIIAGEWMDQLGEIVADLEEPVGQAVEAARMPWWR